MLTTHGGPTVEKQRIRRFVNEVLEGAQAEVEVIDRANSLDASRQPADETDADRAALRWPDGSCRCPAGASGAWRFAWRGRARRPPGRHRYRRSRRHSRRGRPSNPSWRRWGSEPRVDADAARAAGLDPLTFRELALDSGAGANLLDIVPLPAHFSYSAFSTYEACPMRYAFNYVYRIPPPSARSARSPSAAPRTRPSRRSRRSGASAWRAARRHRPARTSSASSTTDGSRPASATRPPRRATSAGSHAPRELLDRRGRHPRRGDPRGAALRAGDRGSVGAPPVIVHGSIDRIDRLPSGGIEVIDYKTGTCEPEGRRREPPALHLRARLPRRPRPRHPGAGDVLLHRVGHCG